MPRIEVKIEIKPLEKLIDEVSAGIGRAYLPRAIVKEAEARGKAIKIITEASTEAVTKGGNIAAVAMTAQLSADAEIGLMETSGIVDRANFRLSHNAITEQKNIESVIGHAIRQLPKEVSNEDVDPDWRTRFFRNAKDISHKLMQEVWGRVLAQEVANPGSYSLRTLEVLKNLTQKEAELFQRVCRYAIAGGWLIRTSSSDKIPGFVEFDDVLTLRDCGLFHPEGHMGDTWEPNMLHETERDGEIKYGFRLLFHGGILDVVRSKRIKIHFPSINFSRAGRELLRLVPPDPDLEYIDFVRKYFVSEGIHIEFEPMPEEEYLNQLRTGNI